MKTISFKFQFIDSARFMASSLSILVDKLAERIHKIKCKNEHDKKTGAHVELSTKIVSAVLHMQVLKMI